MEWLEYDWKIEGMNNFVSFLAKKYNLKVDEQNIKLAKKLQKLGNRVYVKYE